MNKILDKMLFEFKNNIRNGVYGYTQKIMAYNSNRIEGNHLSVEHTSSLFDTQSFVSDDVYRPKDVEEMSGHFLMFNHMLKTIDKPLTEDLIKEFHRCLKEGVFEDKANGYVIGDYKARENIIGVYKTAKPNRVHEAMSNLLDAYDACDKTLESILALHAAYEIIHPFQDGNGRTGRLIMFRECLIDDVKPFIVRDCNKARYISALNNARVTGNVNELVSYVKTEQESYEQAIKGMI